MAEKKENLQQLNIELPDDIAEGVYSNLAFITFSFSEFIIDFVKVMMIPGKPPKAKVKSRVILTPHHAKRLMKIMKDNIGKYEEHFGHIEDTDPMSVEPFHFGGPPAQA